MNDNANKNENGEVIFEDGTMHKFCEVCGDCVYCDPHCWCELQVECLCGPDYTCGMCSVKNSKPLEEK